MARNDVVGLVLQANWDTPVTTMTFWPPVTSEGITIDRTVMEIDEAIGSYAPTDRTLGTKIWRGPVAGAVRTGSLPIFITGLCGHPTTTNPTSGVYNHAYVVGGTGHAPHMMCVETVNRDPATDIVDLYYNAYIDSLELSCEVNDYMMMSAEFVAGAIDTAQSNPTETLDATSKMTFKQITAELSTDGGALTAFTISRFRVAFGNGLEPKPFKLGSYLVPGIDPGNITCDVEFDTMAAPNTMYRDVLADTQSYYNLKITATGDLITGAHYHNVIVDVKKVRLTAAPVDIDAANVMNSVSFTGIGVTNGTSVAAIDVKNANAGTNY